MARRPEKHKQQYGTAEWYGRKFSSLSNAERVAYLETRNTQQPCPFFHQVPALGPKSGRLNCNKAGGVCSIRNFQEPRHTEEDLTFGPVTATCPNRFLENGVIVEHIGRAILGTSAPHFGKEITFLRRPKSKAARAAVEESVEDDDATSEDESPADQAREDVGRIDLVFVDPENKQNWCAVEMQAVYFSGATMTADHANIRGYSGNGVPMPGGGRRPDFRSSGPKRLMPQLQIKVPTLRRWGKKMVVVIDKPFLDAMDDMERIDHISNCDIVWVVVDYDETTAPGEVRLVIHDTIFTTLEAAVTGLTAGEPTTLPEFEARLGSKVAPALGG
ncbi:NotI family restriction endonuclease [Pelagibacterium sp.]|uniref:NotI family restriction endonuclease n=1 Tax=Pelagibacterium sp. TaxID=1967288 RepID=UPI003A91A1F9